MTYQVQFSTVKKNLGNLICLCLEGQACLVPQSSKQELLARNRKAEGELPIDVILDEKTIKRTTINQTKYTIKKQKERQRDSKEEKGMIYQIKDI